MDPETKKKLIETNLAERFEYERHVLRSGSQNGYEIIFPSMCDEDINVKYEGFLKKANDIWDEFTTGNKGLKHKKELEKTKTEPLEKKNTIKRNSDHTRGSTLKAGHTANNHS